MSEPLMTCRKRIDGIETEENRYLGKQPEGNLPTAQVVSGMEVARAWLRLWCKTWEPVASKAAVGLGERPGAAQTSNPGGGTNVTSHYSLLAVGRMAECGENEERRKG